MQWTKLKKRVESLFAPAVAGRVELRSTSYRKTHDQEGRAYITIDGDVVWNMDTSTWWAREYRKRSDFSLYQGIPPSVAHSLARDALGREGVYGQQTFYASLLRFSDSTIAQSLKSPDVLVRALAMCDRRLGKRRLRNLDMSQEHPIVRLFNQFRLLAEGITRAEGERITRIVNVGELRRDLDKTKRFVDRELSTGLMSTTKWRKMIGALVDADLGLQQMLVKFVDDEEVKPLHFPPSLRIPWPWFDTVEFGPVAFLAVEWLEIPAVAIWPTPSNAPANTPQDIEGATQTVSSLGEYPISVSENGLRVTGWVR